MNKTSVGEYILIGLAILAGAAVLMSPVACAVHRQRTIADLIERGADPIAAKCAVEGSTDYSPVCIAKAASK